MVEFFLSYGIDYRKNGIVSRPLLSRPRQPQPTAIPDRYSRRCQDLKREFQQLKYFCKGMLLKRMMKCGKAQCACRQDPDKRHGPYFESLLNHLERLSQTVLRQQAKRAQSARHD
jgi:hypothetical protein